MKKKLLYILFIGILLIGMTGCGNQKEKSSSENSESDNSTLYPIYTGSLYEDAKWGYVNTKGEVVIEPQYDSAYGFYEGLAAVAKDGKLGYINNKNEFVIEAKYEYPSGYTYEKWYVDNFSEGIACVSTGGISNYVYIDKDGNELFGKTFYDCSSFKNGIARVMPRYGETIYIDTKGNEVEAPEEQEPEITLYQGYDESIYYKDHKPIFEDKNFDKKGEFNNFGYAVVGNETGTGLIDTNGEYVIEPGKYSNFYFDDDNPDMIFAEIKKDDITYIVLIDKNGKEYMETKYVTYYIYDDAYVFKKGDNYLIIKKDGTKVAEFTI